MEWAEKLPNILATTGMRSLSRTRTDRACGQCSLSIIFSASYFLPPPIRSRGNAPRMTTLRMSGGVSQWQATGGGTKATTWNFFVSLTIILISSKYNFVIAFDINLKFRCKFMSWCPQIVYKDVKFVCYIIQIVWSNFKFMYTIWYSKSSYNLNTNLP